METITLKPSQLSAALAELIDLRIPACVWGRPGIGKSEITYQSAAMCSKLGKRQVKEFRAALSEPTDLKGFGMVRTENGQNYTAYAVPYDLPKPSDGPGLLFCDEVNRAPMATQNTLMQLCLNPFRLGEYQLPDDWSIHVACNGDSDGGGTVKMPGALAERFVHFYLEPDLDDVCKWGFDVDKSGQDTNLDPLVVAFLRFRPQLLAPDYDRTQRANPNPRAWKFVSDIVRGNPKRDKAITLAMVAGKVGHSAAIEFMAFYDLYAKLPNLDRLLLNPSTEPIPTEAGTKYAVASALARRATITNLKAVLTFMGRLPDQEFTLLTMKDATRRDPVLASTPEFTRWAISNPV